jgi:hypothetical protein
MPTTPATGDATARTVQEQFLDLMCNDADLVTAEFDAIIAAQWPNPPADRPGRGAAGGHPVNPAARRTAANFAGPVDQPRHPGIGGWARQRSPPLRDATNTRQKGR